MKNTTPDPSTRSRRAVVAFGLTSFFSDLAHEAVSSVLPLLVRTLGGPPALALGVIEGVSDAASAFCKLAGGRIADRLRRLKPTTVAGYVATGLTIPLIGFATAWWQILFLRTVAWCGRGFRSPLRDTLLTRSVEPAARGRAFGLERAMDQTGAVLAPIVVILLLRDGLSVSTIIVLSIIPGLLAVLAIVAFVRESERTVSHAASVPHHDPLPESFRRFLVALFVFGSGDFAKTMLVLWSLGLSVELASTGDFTTGILLYAGFNAVTVIAALVGGRLSDRLGRRRVLIFGYGAGTAAAVCPMLLAPSFTSGALALALSGILVGIEESVERAWAADLAPEGKRGRGFGYVHAVNGAGDMVASVLVGALWTWAGASVAFGAAAALMALGTILMARLQDEKHA